jgi:hypothetical protein
MKIVNELIEELSTMKAREERAKDARTLIHSAIGKVKRRPLDENLALAIETDLWEAIEHLEDR